MGLDLFLPQYRRMALAILGGYCLQVGATLQQALGLVVVMVLERMAEVLGLGLGAW